MTTELAEKSVLQRGKHQSKPNNVLTQGHFSHFIAIFNGLAQFLPKGKKFPWPNGHKSLPYAVFSVIFPLVFSRLKLGVQTLCF